MSEIVRFDTNIVVEVTLKFADGKEVEGRYGQQFMFTLEGDKIMYVPPIVAARITELGLGRGDRVQICKRELKDGRRKGVAWDVKRVDPPQQPGSRPAAAASNQPKPNAQLQTQPTTGERPAVMHTEGSRFIAAALTVSIDALL